MKKSLLFTIALGLMALGSLHAQKYLYVDSMYPRSSVTRTMNIMYQRNISVLTGSPKMDTFRMDVYNPTLNASPARPLVIFLHTGSFLPRYINQTPTGGRDDSATVEFCTQMAQRGYVVAAISYRLGWNPALATEDERKSSIINAAYKSVQDIAAAVRFFKYSIKFGNEYSLDSTKFAIGGQGTGSYAMYAYAGLEKQEDIKIAKFYDFGLNKAMVLDSVWGDRFGFKIPGSPAPYATENYKGHTSNSAVGFAISGCMGDSSWVKTSQIPLISVHGVKDPFGPYKTGLVYVPGTLNPVVEVSGGHTIMDISNKLGKNSIYASKSVFWTDPYSVKSRTMNENIEGLYPFHGAGNGSGPWEWWDDSATLNAKLLGSGKFTQPQITTIIKNGKATNPFMSKARALNYIDTSLGYIMPRVACAMGLWNCSGGQYGTASVDNIDLSNSVTMFPNPANSTITVAHHAYGQTLQNVTITDLNGRSLQTQVALSSEVSVALNLTPGIYLVHLNFDNGHAVKKLVVQ